MLLNNQSFSDADAENTCVNLSFRVVNDTVVKIPQIALKDSEGAYTVQQGEDIEIAFEGDDPFVSVTGNGITEADYTADTENGTVTISQDFLKLLTVNTELTFSLNGEQSSVSFTVKIEPTEGFVQIMTSAREFIYDKASLDNLEIGITGDAFGFHRRKRDTNCRLAVCAGRRRKQRNADNQQVVFFEDNERRICVYGHRGKQFHRFNNYLERAAPPNRWRLL